MFAPSIKAPPRLQLILWWRKNVDHSGHLYQRPTTNTADTRGGEQMSIIRDTYINAPPRIQLTLVVPLQSTKAKINCSICPFHPSVSNVFASVSNVFAELVRIFGKLGQCTLANQLANLLTRMYIAIRRGCFYPKIETHNYIGVQYITTADTLYRLRVTIMYIDVQYVQRWKHTCLVASKQTDYTVTKMCHGRLVR
jgi:hypothetical protein